MYQVLRTWYLLYIHSTALRALQGKSFRTYYYYNSLFATGMPEWESVTEVKRKDFRIESFGLGPDKSRELRLGGWRGALHDAFYPSSTCIVLLSADARKIRYYCCTTSKYYYYYKSLFVAGMPEWESVTEVKRKAFRVEPSGLGPDQSQGVGEGGVHDAFCLSSILKYL